MNVTVAIDCMGGDHGPSVTLPAAISFLRHNPNSRVILVALNEVLSGDALRPFNAFGDRVEQVQVTQMVEMHENVASALRTKKDSSMRVAIDLVKEGRAQAVVSAGNTGALMAIARFVLKTLPGIDRPAIASALPTMRGHTYVLDLGANVDCEAEHLLQFGIMGSALVEALEHAERPSVGLLNIGEEEIKGNEVVKRAAELLRVSGLNFYGNVEGNDIYKGTTDIVVCDGFSGNVVLKASEGIAQMLAFFLRQEFKRNWLTHLMALAALPVLKRFKNRVDHRRYNGASLLGLRGVVIKSHGSADAFGFEQAIWRAAESAHTKLLERITQRIDRYSSASTARLVS